MEVSPAPRLLETVPSTKLHPPRLGRHLVAREALLERLLQARARRCIVVQGPAGSGKTSLAAAWRQALLAQQVEVAWLSLVAEDDEPRRFCACVLASLARLDPELARPAAQLLERDDDADADELWVITLVQSLSEPPALASPGSCPPQRRGPFAPSGSAPADPEPRGSAPGRCKKPWERPGGFLGDRGRELVLVLDDVQHLTHPRIGRMLHWLLEYAPPQLHLVLLTRGAVPLPLERPRAQGQLAEFDLRDLRFTPDETAQFLREQLGNIPQQEVARLHEATDGWIAGLQLLAIQRKVGHVPEDVAAEASGRIQDAQAFAGYFEREVLQRLPADDLDLLMHCAVSHRFCVSLCAALLRQPEPAVGRRLAHVLRADLFVSRVSGDGGETWYRVHPLLREVLLLHLAARSEDAARALHRIAWRWFDARGAIDEAVRHAVLAGEAEAGADLIVANADSVLARSGMAQLGVLVRLLPPDLVKRRFGLRLLMAHLLLAVRNLPAVEAEVAEMEEELAQSRPVSDGQRQGLAVLRAGLAMQRDDSDAIASLRPRLEAIPDGAAAFDVERRGQALAWLHMTRGDHALARQALDASERACAGDERHLLLDAFRGMSLAFEGRLADAETLLRAVLERAQRQPDSDGTVVCVAAGLLCDPLYEANALSAVRELIEPRIELLERSVIPDILLRSMTVLSSTHWILGNRLEALAIAQRLEDHALRHRLDRALAQALQLQLRWQLREGKLDAGRALLQRIETLGERHSQAAPGTLAHVLRVVGRARVSMSLHWNDFAQAKAHLLQMLSGAEGAQRWREVAAIRMQLVLAARGDGREDEGRAHLDEALRLGHRMGLMRSLLDAGSAVPELLRQWQERREGQGGAVGDPVLSFYVGRLLAAAEQARAWGHPPSAPSRAAGTVTLSERETEVLALVAQVMPNKRIARAMNVTPHTVKFHLRNIYMKLGVSERDQALARWRELQGATGRQA